MVARQRSDGARRLTVTEMGTTVASTAPALRRLFERSLVGLLIAVIAWALLDRARDVRSAAELSAFRQSLGALRIALVLDRMHTMVGGAVAEGAMRNPFLLLTRPPANYSGDVPLGAAEAGAVAPGAWFFDRHCPCVGYRPRDDRRFLAPSGRAMMVFRLSSPGLLAARETYVWRGEVLD